MYPFVSLCFYAVFNKNHDLIRLYTSFFLNEPMQHGRMFFFLFTWQPISNFFITLKHDGLFLLYTPDYFTLYWIYFASTDRRTREANNCYFNEIAAEALCANYKNNLSIDMLVNLN